MYNQVLRNGILERVLEDRKAFGMGIKNREYVAFKNFRYSFNGKEKTDEVSGSGNNLDFSGRSIYDTRLSRFTSVDTRFRDYPALSPYSFAANNPIIYIDQDGEGPFPVIVFGVKALSFIKTLTMANTVTSTGGIQGGVGVTFAGSAGVAIDKYNNVLLFTQTSKGVQSAMGLSIVSSTTYSNSSIDNVTQLLGSSLYFGVDVSTGAKFVSVGGGMEGTNKSVQGITASVSFGPSVGTPITVAGGKSNTSGIVLPMWELEAIADVTSKAESDLNKNTREYNQNEANHMGGWGKVRGTWLAIGTTTTLELVGDNKYEVVVTNTYYFASNSAGTDISENVKKMTAVYKTGVVFEKDKDGNLISTKTQTKQTIKK